MKLMLALLPRWLRTLESSTALSSMSWRADQDVNVGGARAERVM